MRNYLSALWGHRVALMSGLVGLLMAVSLRIGRQVSTNIRLWSDIPDWMFICVGAACLFWAGYLTWGTTDTERSLIFKSV